MEGARERSAGESETDYSKLVFGDKYSANSLKIAVFRVAYDLVEVMNAY